MDKAIIQARLPYDTPGSIQPEPRAFISRAFINQFILDMIREGRFRDIEAQATSALLRAKLALLAYHKERNHYPETLAELVQDGYLSRVPEDPFAGKFAEPLHYKRLSDSQYLLYSVGPDGTDDGGKPIVDRRQNGMPNIQPQSKGDLTLDAGF